jgi:hypothetical protein
MASVKFLAPAIFLHHLIPLFPLSLFALRIFNSNSIEHPHVKEKNTVIDL